MSVPKDLSKVKSKAILNKFTVRQALCFAVAALLGLPTYFLTRNLLGQSLSAIVMVTIMVPFFLLAMYEKDGLPLEKIIYNIIMVRFVLPTERPYQTTNLYDLKDNSHSTQQEEVAVGKAKRNHSQS